MTTRQETAERLRREFSALEQSIRAAPAHDSFGPPACSLSFVSPGFVWRTGAFGSGASTTTGSRCCTVDTCRKR